MKGTFDQNGSLVSATHDDTFVKLLNNKNNVSIKPVYEKEI